MRDRRHCPKLGERGPRGEPRGAQFVVARIDVAGDENTRNARGGGPARDRNRNLPAEGAAIESPLAGYDHVCPRKRLVESRRGRHYVEAAFEPPAHERDDPGPHPSAGTGAGNAGDLGSKLRFDALREPDQSGLEIADRAGRRPLLRSEHAGRAAIADERMVDVVQPHDAGAETRSLNYARQAAKPAAPVGQRPARGVEKVPAERPRRTGTSVGRRRPSDGDEHLLRPPPKRGGNRLAETARRRQQCIPPVLGDQSEADARSGLYHRPAAGEERDGSGNGVAERSGDDDPVDLCLGRQDVERALAAVGEGDEGDLRARNRPAHTVGQSLGRTARRKRALELVGRNHYSHTQTMHASGPLRVGSMSAGVRVVFASNRGPVSFVRTAAGGFETRRGAGGLAGSLDPVARGFGREAVWIAAATSAADRDAVRAGAVAALGDRLGYRVDLIDIDPVTYAGYYDGISNRMLWFANHDLWDELGVSEFAPEEVRAWTEAYEPVNHRFATAAAECAAADALVLIQDYHLAAAPRHLRDIGYRGTILHFTHTSFSAKGLGPLPDPIRRAVVEGMLAADLVGFHTPDWAAEFLAASEDIGALVDRGRGTVEHAGRRSWVRCYPIPIDAGGLLERARAPAAAGWAERVLHDAGERRLVVRADRVEPSKNIVRGFEAFGQLLDRRADIRDSVRFVACIYPSRQSMDEYRSYADAVRIAADAVNERHPRAVDLQLADDFDRSLGCLRAYDVLLVNSLMDGMNLVSKEGPTVNDRDGVVVLSRTAGSFEELGDHAVEIGDPRDVEATSFALERALELSAGERARRAAALKRLCAQRRPADWIEAQLRDLGAVSQGRAPQTPAPGAT